MTTLTRPVVNAILQGKTSDEIFKLLPEAGSAPRELCDIMSTCADVERCFQELREKLAALTDSITAVDPTDDGWPRHIVGPYTMGLRRGVRMRLTAALTKAIP